LGVLVKLGERKENDGPSLEEAEMFRDDQEKGKWKSGEENRL